MKPMTRRAKQPLQAVSLLQHESLFLGIDVGKTRHVAGFVSKTLLERHQRFEACPALAFENNREGFQALVERMRALAPLEHYAVLMEKTGHYHKALQQFLQELDIPRDACSGAAFCHDENR
jgi:transposase